MYESADGEVLYCMVRRFKPKRVIEVGSGYPTYLTAQAILKNQDENKANECELTAIDPFANETLRKGFPGLPTLIPKSVQDIPVSEFQKLRENDIHCID